MSNETLINRLMQAVRHSETTHELFDYENSFEGRYQHIYNEGIIWGMKHVLISAIDYTTRQTDREIHDRMTDEFEFWEDQHYRFASCGRFETLDEEIDGEGNVEGFRHMLNVMGAYIEDKELTDDEVLSLVE